MGSVALVIPQLNALLTGAAFDLHASLTSGLVTAVDGGGTITVTGPNTDGTYTISGTGVTGPNADGTYTISGTGVSTANSDGTYTLTG